MRVDEDSIKLLFQPLGDFPAASIGCINDAHVQHGFALLPEDLELVLWQCISGVVTHIDDFASVLREFNVVESMAFGEIFAAVAQKSSMQLFGLVKRKISQVLDLAKISGVLTMIED